MLKLILIAIAFMITGCSDASSNCTKEDTLKLIGAGFSKAEISDMCGQAGKRASTDSKSSAVEGKLVDRNGAPVADVKITAAQVQPIKGYEQFEAVTESDGTFRIEGLFPSSSYVLKPWSKKWRSKTAAQVGSAPQGETAVLPSPMVIKQAFSKESGIMIDDLVTGAPFQSAVKGKLVDWNGAPVVNVKITAKQQQPMKGYEQFEAETNSNGAFRIEGLFPSSTYVLRPWSDKWSTETNARVNSAPQGETVVLPSAMVISRAFTKNGGSLVGDLATGAMRFSVSNDSVISDLQTGLDWLVGPDQNTDYKSAERWIASISDVAGGNWRMPTIHELKRLYQKGGAGESNLVHPAFKMTDRNVWAEPYDSSSAWLLNFSSGRAGRLNRKGFHGDRVFGVRSRPTDTSRYSVSGDGVISDSQTGLDWKVGPDRNTNYDAAEQWIASISDTAGGNWRMPTRGELKSIYQKGVGERNMDPAFKTTGWNAWAEPYDSSSAWGFLFSFGSEGRHDRYYSGGFRVFGVRERPKLQTSTKSQPASSQATDPAKDSGRKENTKVQLWHYFCTDEKFGNLYKTCSKETFSYEVPWAGRRLDRDTARTEDSTAFSAKVNAGDYKERADNHCKSLGFTRASEEWPLFHFMNNWYRRCKNKR